MCRKSAMCLIYVLCLYYTNSCAMMIPTQSNINISAATLETSTRNVTATKTFRDKVMEIIERYVVNASEIILRAIEKETTRHDCNKTHETPNKRVKRQTGKFTDAAKTDNLKMFRIYLTMFKNTWSGQAVGGSHPMHKDVPKPVILMFKEGIMEFFFPPIGAPQRD